MNECINKTKCEWWYCKTYGECLLHRQSLPNNLRTPVITRLEDSDDSWEYQLSLLRIGKEKREKLNIKKRGVLNRSEFKLQSIKKVKQEAPKSKIEGNCVNPLCKSDEDLTRHHLIPKSAIPKGISDSDTYKKVVLCQDCHTLVHQLKNNDTLARYYSTEKELIELLAENEILRKERKNNSKVVRCINIYCGTTENLTRHHLIPKPYRKGLVVPSDKVFLCIECHKKVHNLATNKQLADRYNTKDSIIELLQTADKKFVVSRVLDVFNQANPVMAVA